MRIGRIAGEQLVQHAVARNVGNSPTALTGRIAYSTNSGSTGEVSLPRVQLAPGETREIELAKALEESGLKNIVAAGLQFEYSGQPGGVIMSARSVSDSGNQVFRVPLVDAKTQDSSTGKYPWMIEDSGSTFVYLKNTTDHSQRYQLQINYDGGAYSPGIKTIAAGQTIAFDLRKLRDQQVPDEGAHTIPASATRGQVYWSVDGHEDLTMIGRAEQVDVVRGLSITSSCGTCCPASFNNGWCDPVDVTGFPGDTSQFTAMQQKQDCYGNLLSPTVAISVTWSSTDTTVATVDSTGFATAQSPGPTNIRATWEAHYIDFYQNGCSWDPDNCTGGHCYHRFQDFIAEAICDVTDSAVTFRTARVSGTRVNFNGAPQRAVLDLPPSAFTDGICHNFEIFTCTVSFNLPDGAIALSDSRSRVRCVKGGPDKDCDGFIYGGTFQNVDLSSTPKRGEMAIKMHRKTTEGPNAAPSINITVAGDYGTGTFSTTGVLTINCPN